MKGVSPGAFRVLINPVRLLASINKGLLLSLVFIVGLLPQQLLAEDVAGFMPGEFSVSPGGAAKYDIPIEVPPGTASMQPNLSIKYSSQGKNGLLGVGWSLGGLSSISRCQATIAQDDFNGGIKLDGDDRFCLDGRRLVAINGTAGADGTEYRTEIDSFAKIVSYGQSGSGPAYWKVWTKSGRIIEYGNTDDSSLEAQGNDSILRWSVNKITDAVGNYLNVTYIEDAGVGGRRPDRIDYAGNESVGTSPQLSVRFEYGDRTDVINKYISGSKITTSKRLVSVKTYENENLVKEYRLVYEYGAATKRSRIKDITECGAYDCKPATTLTWHDQDQHVFEDVAETNDASINGTWNDGFCTGDYDGDGLTDLVRLNYENWPQKILRLFLARRDGSFNVLQDIDLTEEGFPFTSLSQDYNGDGLTDLYSWVGDYGQYKHEISFSKGDGTFEHAPSQPFSNMWCDWNYPGDVNGDGLSDIVAIKRSVSTPVCTNSLATYISNGDGTFSEVFYQISISTQTGVYDWSSFRDGHPEILTPGDFNGDGRTDFVTYAGDGDRLLVFISKGDGTYAEKVQTTQKAYASFEDASYQVPTRLVYSGDFNGDGITDLFSFASDGSGLITFFGKGDGSFEEIFEPYNDPDFDRRYASIYKVIVEDINADGLADVIYQTRRNDVTLVSKGDGTYAPYNDLLSSSIGYYHWAGDFNGDGQGDLLSEYSSYSDSSGTFTYGYRTTVSNTNQIKPDLLNSITDGLGDKTQISYKPLTDNTIYTKGSGAAPGTEKDIQVPAYVVTQVDSDNGIGGQNSISFKYGGLKVNIKGRGSLGFAWREETDLQTGIVKKIEYRQDFPYLGKVSHAEVRHSNGTLLSETTSTLADIITHDLASGPDVHFPYISQLIEKKYELNGGALVTTTTTTNTYDDYGNPTQVGVVAAGAPWNENRSTVNTYSNDETNWHIGDITQTTETYGNPQGTEVRSASYAYNSAGLVIQEVIEPDNTELRQQTDYEYDNFGNQTVVTLSGADVESRATTTVYDSQGRYPVSVTNALGHTETYTYDASFGVMTSLTGPNGLTTSWQYDGFGNKIREDRADGTWTTITYGQCGVTGCPEDAPQDAGLYTTTLSAGSTPETIFHDKKNREIRKVATGFDGTLVYEDAEYNSVGQVSGKSQPYYKGGAVYWTRYAYDDVNRVLSMARPSDDEPDPDPLTGGNRTTYSYNGLTVSETNSLNQTTIRVRDQADNLFQVTDHDGNVTTYIHSPTGNLLNTIDPAGNVVAIGYNVRGWKASMNDPDMGARSYQYNVYGELISQTDAKGQTVSMVYDQLGRMVQRTEPEGITTWTYDTAENGIGKLAQVDAPVGYQQTITYDSLGRAITTSSAADGRTLSITTEYDELGRVSKTIRPEGFIVANTYNAQGYLEAVYSPSTQIGDYDTSHIRFLLDTAINDAEAALNKAQEVADAAFYYQQKAAEYQALSGIPELDADLEAQLQSIAAELDAASDILNIQADSYLDLAEQLTEVAEQLYARQQILLQRYAYGGENENISHYQSMVDDSGNVYLWRAKSRDAAGRLTSSIVGNGLETQDIYNQATGQLTDIISSFGYATPIRELGYEYNSLNNVTSRIDRVQGLNESFEYDRLNRLTRSYVSGTIAGVNYDYNIDYSYDAIGNITYKSDVGNYTYGDQGRTAGNAGPHALLSAGADHTGYQYDLNGNMLQGGGRSIAWSSFDKPIEFRKDGSVKASFKYDSERVRYLKVTPESRTYYLGKAYERIESNNKVEHKYFIYADGELVAIHVKTTNDGEAQPDETRYLHRDSLGSIDTITDGQGRIIDRMSYEPFGARRGGDWRVNTGEPLIPALTNRGFTGHEHVDEMDLIHMNGRVYDPVIGRFISADPTIQFPYNQQSYNRYSYVLNNPLKYTDPSGYSATGAWDQKEWEQGDWRFDIREVGGLASGYGTGSFDSFGLEGDGSSGASFDDGYLGGGVNYDPVSGWSIDVNWYTTPPQYKYVEDPALYGGGSNAIGWSEKAHNALDVAGWVPGLGSVSSVIDGAIYAYEGDWTTAAFAFAGVLGPAGKAFGKFGRVAKGSRSLWTSTKSKSAVENAFSHWKKHKGEFSEFQNAKQYVEGARKFVNSPPKGTLTKTRSNGDTLLYNQKTNTFGVKNADGVTRTLFRPKDGIDYWNKQ